MAQNILVVGASGSVGSEIVRLLEAKGHSVRTTTSKKSIASKNQVHLNVLTDEGRQEAFTGIDRAFLLSPGGYVNHYEILAPLIQEAKSQGIKKLVLMTAMGVDAVETSPLRRAEIDLEKSGLNYNIIRPNWFMQNFNTFWVQSIREQGKILLPAGDSKTSFIDTRDISAVAAELLVNDRLNNKAFNLTGPESLDHHQVARAISEATGKKITYQEIAPQDLKQGLLAAGLQANYVDFLLMIIEAQKAGYAAAVTDEVKNILGRSPSSFQKYAQDYKNAWI